MGNQKNRTRPGQGTRIRLAKEAALHAANAGKRAKDAARQKAKRAAKKEHEEALKLLATQLETNQAVVAELAESILDKIGSMGPQLGGAILRAVILSPKMKPLRMAGGLSRNGKL